MSALDEDLVPVVILTLDGREYELTPNEYFVWLQTGRVSKPSSGSTD